MAVSSCNFLSFCFLQKLRDKFAQDTEKFKTLQDIVESEIEAKTTLAKNSATDALLWLKRLVILIYIMSL